MLIRFITLLFTFLALAAPSYAQSDPKDLLNALGKANFKQTEALLGQIAATGDPRVVPALEAFAEGELFVRPSSHGTITGNDTLLISGNSYSSKVF